MKVKKKLPKTKTANKSNYFYVLVLVEANLITVVRVYKSYSTYKASGF